MFKGLCCDKIVQCLSLFIFAIVGCVLCDIVFFKIFSGHALFDDFESFDTLFFVYHDAKKFNFSIEDVELSLHVKKLKFFFFCRDIVSHREEFLKNVSVIFVELGFRVFVQKVSSFVSDIVIELEKSREHFDAIWIVGEAKVLLIEMNDNLDVLAA